MLPRPPESHDDALQRFLSDLRRSVERRTSVDRRCAARPVLRDRRDGGERRARAERRQMLEAYSDAEAAEIKQMITDPAAHVTCPACDGHLMLGPPTRQDCGTVRRVHCTHCRRSVTVRTPPC